MMGKGMVPGLGTSSLVNERNMWARRWFCNKQFCTGKHVGGAPKNWLFKANQKISLVITNQPFWCQCIFSNKPSTWVGNIRRAFGLLLLVPVEGAVPYFPRIISHQIKFLLVGAVLLCPLKKWSGKVITSCLGLGKCCHHKAEPAGVGGCRNCESAVTLWG